MDNNSKQISAFAYYNQQNQTLNKKKRKQEAIEKKICEKEFAGKSPKPEHKKKKIKKEIEQKCEKINSNQDNNKISVELTKDASNIENEISEIESDSSNDFNDESTLPIEAEETNGYNSSSDVSSLPLPKKKQSYKHSSKKVLEKSTSGVFVVDDSDSISAGKQFFSWIINPVKVEEFFKNFWEKQFLLIQRSSPCYSSLLSCEDIDKMLLKHTLYFNKNIDITVYTRKSGFSNLNPPSGRATPSLVWQYYNQGHTVRILNPQTFLPKVHALSAALQEFFGCLVGANVYLTPPNSQGFAPHYDDIEAFVVQVEGTKLWKVYAPRTPDEILPRFSSKNFTESDLGPPIQEVLLKAGDLLYFPRGFIHQGLAQKNHHSLHITFSVYQKNSWADFLETLLPVALQSAIEEDVSFREGLPLQYLSHIGLIHSDKASQFRTDFFEKVESMVHKLIQYAPIDAAADQMGKKFIHDSLPPYLRNEEKEMTVYKKKKMVKKGKVVAEPKILLSTEVKLIRYNCIRLLREEDALRIYYSNNNSKEYHGEDPQFIEISEDTAPAIDILIESYPDYICVKNLPLRENTNKIELVNELWSLGIIKSKHPLY